MSVERVRQRFGRLPAGMKFVGIGSLFLAVSAILPWYSDLDAYGVGDMFLGISGPASFIGLVILALSLGSLFFFAAHLLERKKPKLPVSEPAFHLFAGLQSLFLLMMAASIYFHPKFGINITLKEPRFGLIVAFLSAVVLSYGGYVQHRKEEALEESIGKLEPLVSMQKQPSRTVISHPFSRDVEEEEGEEIGSAVMGEKKISPLKERLPRSFSFGEAAKAEREHRAPEHARSAQESIGYTERKLQEIREKQRQYEEEHTGVGTAQEEKKSDLEGGGSYKIRMDL